MREERFCDVAGNNLSPFCVPKGLEVFFQQGLCMTINLTLI